MTEMLRYNEGKRRVSIFPPCLMQYFLTMEFIPIVFIEEVTKVLEFGAEKYDLHNWKKSGSWHRCADSAVRHILKHASGEKIDPESGLSHLAHLGCNLAFLYEFVVYQTGVDDRWKGYPTTAFIQEEDTDLLTDSFIRFLAWVDGGDHQFLYDAIHNLALYMQEPADVD